MTEKYEASKVMKALMFGAVIVSVVLTKIYTTIRRNKENVGNRVYTTKEGRNDDTER